MTYEPLPFYDDPWRGDRAEAARAIWDWHLAVRGVAMEGTQARARLASAGGGDTGAAQVVGTDLARRVRDVTASFALDAGEFAVQLDAAQLLAGDLRFVSLNEQREFFDQWICPVGRLLASVANVSGILHVGYVNALSNGFYLLSRVLELPRDVPSGRIFIPQRELTTFSVDESQLIGGPPDERVRKLMWKQCVRIRDYFARALPLSRDLPRRYAVVFRRWWLGGLEMVNAIERAKYDVWTAPIRLSVYRRSQARLQARWSRTLSHHK